MILSDTREIILALKEVYAKKQLSIDKVKALVDDKVGKNSVSRSTVQAVFAKGSEDDTRKFGYDTVLKPLCIALLDMETIEQDDPDDIKVFKSVLRLKKDIISELTDELKDEKLKAHEKFEEEIKPLTKQIAFLSHQIELKDQRIDTLLRLLEKVMNES